MIIPMIDKHAVSIVVGLLDQHLGTDITEHALRQSQLCRASLSNGPGFVPLYTELQLIEAAARKVGDRHLGLTLGMHHSYADFGPVADYVQSAPDLLSAIARGTLSLPYIQPGGRAQLKTVGSHVLLSYEYGAPTINGIQHTEEAIPFLLTDLIRGFMGKDWHPDWIELPGQADIDFDAYGISAPVHWQAQAPGIAFAQKILRFSNPKRTRHTLDLGDVPRLTGLQKLSGLTDRVNEVFPLHAEQQDLSVAAIAGRLSLGVRSLERQLQAEGTSFRSLKQSFLRDRACSLLAEPGTKPDEVAFALGYREPNSFRRAFRNWTGQTPAAFATAARAALTP